MNLISNTEFGKQLVPGKMDNELFEMIDGNITDSVYRRLRDNYDDLLHRYLEPGMFVPCDTFGNTLSNPYDYEGNASTEWEEEYEKARSKVLFGKGVNIIRNRENFFIIEDETGTLLRVQKNNTRFRVETLLTLSVPLELTQSALKKIIR